MACLFTISFLYTKCPPFCSHASEAFAFLMYVCPSTLLWYYCCYGNPFPQIQWLVLAQPPLTSSMMLSSHSHTQTTPQPSPSKLETWATRMGLKGSPPVTHPLPPSRTCPITAICTSFQRGATVRRPCLRGLEGCLLWCKALML